MNNCPSEELSFQNQLDALASDTDETNELDRTAVQPRPRHLTRNKVPKLESNRRKTGEINMDNCESEQLSSCSNTDATSPPSSKVAGSTDLEKLDKSNNQKTLNKRRFQFKLYSEETMTEAVAYYHANSKVTSLRLVCKKFGVPRATLSDRVNGKMPVHRQRRRCISTDVKKRKVVDWCIGMEPPDSLIDITTKIERGVNKEGAKLDTQSRVKSFHKRLHKGIAERTVDIHNEGHICPTKDIDCACPIADSIQEMSHEVDCVDLSDDGDEVEMEEPATTFVDVDAALSESEHSVRTERKTYRSGAEQSAENRTLANRTVTEPVPAPFRNIPQETRKPEREGILSDIEEVELVNFVQRFIEQGAVRSEKNITRLIMQYLKVHNMSDFTDSPLEQWVGNFIDRKLLLFKPQVETGGSNIKRKKNQSTSSSETKAPIETQPEPQVAPTLQAAVEMKRKVKPILSAAERSRFIDYLEYYHLEPDSILYFKKALNTGVKLPGDLFSVWSGLKHLDSKPAAPPIAFVSVSMPSVVSVKTPVDVSSLARASPLNSSQSASLERRLASIGKDRNAGRTNKGKQSDAASKKSPAVKRRDSVLTFESECLEPSGEVGFHGFDNSLPVTMEQHVEKGKQSSVASTKSASSVVIKRTNITSQAPRPEPAKSFRLDGLSTGKVQKRKEESAPTTKWNPRVMLVERRQNTPVGKTANTKSSTVISQATVPSSDSVGHKKAPYNGTITITDVRSGTNMPSKKRKHSNESSFSNQNSKQTTKPSSLEIVSGNTDKAADWQCVVCAIWFSEEDNTGIDWIKCKCGRAYHCECLPQNLALLIYDGSDEAVDKFKCIECCEG